jgi:hypothetical protein
MVATAATAPPPPPPPRRRLRRLDLGLALLHPLQQAGAPAVVVAVGEATVSSTK